MATLTRYEEVVQEHICLYVYSLRLQKFSIFNDVRLVKNIMFQNNPLYYIHHYSGSDNNTEHTVSPNAGEVLNNGGIFKVWFAKADDSVGVKYLLDAIDIYTDEKINKASDVITKMRYQQDVAHDTLDCIM